MHAQNTPCANVRLCNTTTKVKISYGSDKGRIALTGIKWQGIEWQRIGGLTP